MDSQKFKQTVIDLYENEAYQCITDEVRTELAELMIGGELDEDNRVLRDLLIEWDLLTPDQMREKCEELRELEDEKTELEDERDLLKQDLLSTIDDKKYRNEELKWCANIIRDLLELAQYKGTSILAHVETIEEIV